tara:strand:- start:8076 stop:8999 length:924 start_codon:yes stop_codon:yes gene_type:complete
MSAMNIKSLEFVDSIACWSSHQPYFDIIATEGFDEHVCGYAFFCDTDQQLYDLTPHNQKNAMPYLKVDFNQFCLGLDSILKVHVAAKWQPITKAHFLAQACHDLNDRKRVLSLMPLMGLVSQQAVLSDYLKIAGLAPLITQFAFRKKVSAKQLLQLVRFDNHFLAWFDTDILPFIDPSCSVLIRLLETCHDCWQRLGGLKPLQQALTLLDSWQQEPDVAKRLAMFNDCLVSLAYPMKSRYNQHIKECINALALPDFISVHWDQSLENKGFTLQFDISRDHDLERLSVLVEKKEQFQQLLAGMVYDTY